MKKKLQDRILHLGIFPKEKVQYPTTIFKTFDELLIPCIVDICIRATDGKTIARQYFSPPAQLRLHAKSDVIEEIRENLLKGVQLDRLEPRIFPGYDIPIQEQEVMPYRHTINQQMIAEDHPMKRSLSLLEPLLLCPGSRTPESVAIHANTYPCSCLTEDILIQAEPTLLICWEISDILVMGLPNATSEVLILPLLPLLSTQWMLQHTNSFHQRIPGEEKEIEDLKFQRYKVHEAFFKVLSIPRWYQVELVRRAEETEMKTFMLQILFMCTLHAAELITPNSSTVH